MVAKNRLLPKNSLFSQEKTSGSAAGEAPAGTSRRPCAGAKRAKFTVWLFYCRPRYGIIFASEDYQFKKYTMTPHKTLGMAKGTAAMV
jgi:hypothetical protein